MTAIMTDKILRLEKVLSSAEKELHALEALHHLHTGDDKVYHRYKIDNLKEKIQGLEDRLHNAIIEHLDVDADQLDDGSIMQLAGGFTKRLMPN